MQQACARTCGCPTPPGGAAPLPTVPAERQRRSAAARFDGGESGADTFFWLHPITQTQHTGTTKGEANGGTPTSGANAAGTKPAANAPGLELAYDTKMGGVRSRNRQHYPLEAQGERVRVAGAAGTTVGGAVAGVSVVAFVVFVMVMMAEVAAVLRKARRTKTINLEASEEVVEREPVYSSEAPLLPTRSTDL